MIGIYIQLSLLIYIYVYICVYLCMSVKIYVSIYIYIYISIDNSELNEHNTQTGQNILGIRSRIKNKLNLK